MPVTGQVLDDMHHPRQQRVRAGGEDARQFPMQETQPLAYRHPTLQQEGADLIDDAGALTDQPFAYAVQCLQVELIGRLGGDKFHRRPLHRLRDCFGIAKVVLLSFGIRAHIFSRNNPCFPHKTA
jgi:hypothetical protein